MVVSKIYLTSPMIQARNFQTPSATESRCLQHFSCTSKDFGSTGQRRDGEARDFGLGILDSGFVFLCLGIGGAKLEAYPRVRTYTLAGVTLAPRERRLQIPNPLPKQQTVHTHTRACALVVDACIHAACMHVCVYAVYVCKPVCIQTKTLLSHDAYPI